MTEGLASEGALQRKVVASVHYLAFYDLLGGAACEEALKTAGLSRVSGSRANLDTVQKRPTSALEVDLDVLEDTLSFYIRAVNIALSRDLDERLEGLDVARGTGKITILLLVDSHPGIRPSVIARLIMKDRAAMGRLVGQMMEHGLVTRRTSAEDGRAQELYITPKGADLARRVRTLVTRQSKDFFSFIPAADQRLLMDILRRAYRRIVGLPE